MVRGILAVLAGFILWSVIWLATTNSIMAAMPEEVQPGSPVTNTGILLLLLVVSVIASVASGYLTALIAKENTMKYVMAFGVINLAVGIFFQVQNWQFMPLWYHLIFLVLLIPAIVYGGKLRLKQTVNASTT